MPVQIAMVLLVGALFQAGAGEPSTKQPPPGRSHVERFLNPRERAARDAKEATAELAKNAHDVEALSKRGTARVQLGDLNGALADFRRAADLSSDQPDLFTSVGYVFTLLNRFADAHRAFERALALDGENFYANYHYGRLLLLQGTDLKLAASHLERALLARPDYTTIRFDLLTAYRLLKEPELASAQLRYLKAQLPKDPRVQYAEGLLAIDRGDYTSGIATLSSLLAAQPGMRGVRDDLALALVRTGRWSEAEGVLAELVKERPDAVEPAYLHALALFNEGKTVLAQFETGQLVAKYPKSVEVLILHGVVRAANGASLQEQIDLFRQATTLEPRSFDAQFYLGRALYAARQRPAAIAAFTQALEINPNHLKARFFLATALENEGQTDDAEKQYADLASRAPDSPEGHLGLGAVMIKRGDIDQAVGQLSKAVALDASLFEAHFALGKALLRAGRVDESIASLEKAVRIDPSRTEAHYQLGLALRRAGRADEAAREFDTVDRLNEAFRTSSNGMGEPVTP